MMSKPFDATTRNLFEMNPDEWSAYLVSGTDPGRARLIDSNLSTIAAEVDRVIRLEDPIPWLWNIEFQAGRDLALAVRCTSIAPCCIITTGCLCGHP